MIAIRGLLILLLVFNAFISYADRTNMSVAIIHLADRFNYSESQIGIQFSVFCLGYGISQSISGYFSDKYGSKWVLTFACVFWSTSELLTIYAASRWTLFLIVRFCLGLGEGLAFPAIHSFISKWLLKSEHSKAVSLLHAACYMGTIFALLITPFLLQHSLQLVFVVFSLMGAVWTPLWIVFGSSYPSDSKWISEQEKVLITATKEQRSNRIIPWQKILSSKPFWAIIIVHYANTFPITILLFYLPIFLKTYNFTTVQLSLLAIIPNILQMVMLVFANMINSLSLSKKFKRNLFQQTAMIIPAFCTLVFRHLPKIPGLMVLFLGIGFSAWSVVGVQLNHLDISPKYSGLVYGLGNTAASLPGIFGLALVGWLQQVASWDFIFGLQIVHYFIAIVVWKCWSSTNISIA